MTTDPKHLTDSQASAEAARLIREAYRPEPAPIVTSYRDPVPAPLAPTIGSAPPIPQPDSRIVPQWAAGVAVASIGVGTGAVGLGCAAWLFLQALASVTLTGVLAVTAPFAGLAMAATAIGGAISKAKRSSTTNVYKGTVIKRTEITSTARGIGARSRIGE
ncbi:MAG: hypothetical protein HOV82_00915 [Streptomyces sp.]|nr:hypothetical protein [Streptomyces sp.]NUR66957.1 hypothetical protein [Streptomyces sp.]NUS75923.1 hypothetical protein [Streptomyces sp.]